MVAMVGVGLLAPKGSSSQPCVKGWHLPPPLRTSSSYPQDVPCWALTEGAGGFGSKEGHKAEGPHEDTQPSQLKNSDSAQRELPQRTPPSLLKMLFSFLDLITKIIHAHCKIILKISIDFKVWVFEKITFQSHPLEESTVLLLHFPL